MLKTKASTVVACGALAAGLLLLSACKTVSTDRLIYPDAPITYQFVSDLVDEETIEHSVKFRNIGPTVVSFDYTLADEPGVPHVDCLGPNSGLVENLYPGAEVQVKNPLNQMKHVHVTLGRVTHGKRSSQELAQTYKPETVTPGGASPATGSPLPVLDPVIVPGE